MKIRYKSIPTYRYETNTWSTTTFDSQDQFVEYCINLFKEPGEYDFDESTLRWNTEARRFKKSGKFCKYPVSSQDAKTYWEKQSDYNRKGVIWHHNDKTWYIPKDYYMMINFLKVPSNKEKGQNDDFCSVRDLQYHISLYEFISEGLHKHSAVLKRRQCMSSTLHAAKFINIYWFESSKKLKLLAYDDAYITGPQGTWSILESFRDFLNQNTAWTRASMPDGVGEWEQKEKTQGKGGWTYKGRRSSIIAKTLNRNHKGGIGGPSYLVFYEEAGVAPTMDKTLQFLDPAMESGNIRVGSFIAAGSVGDLKDCKPLEKFIKNPEAYGIWGVPTKWYDETGVIKVCGLFIPAQYGLPGYIDQYGNSLVEPALAELKRLDLEKKRDLNTYEYNVWKSQNPTTIQEAFNFREDLYFPTQLIQRRQESIKIEKQENTKKAPIKCLLEEEDGKIKIVPIASMRTNVPIEMEFPVDPKIRDKRGVVTIYEMPPPHPEMYLHFAGVDSIEANITDTSDSLFSVDIVRRGHRKIYYENGEKKERMEGFKLMATYRGRFDDTEDTNLQGELLVRLYNAFTAAERNKPNWINHMRRRNHTKYVMKRRDLTLFKDVDATGIQNDEFGIYMGSNLLAQDILNERIKEKIMEITDIVYKKGKNGEITSDIVKRYRTIDYIDDYWLLEELKLWYHGLNTDRRVSFGLAVMAASCYEMTYTKTVEEKPEEEDTRKRTKVRSLLGGTSRSSFKTGTKRRSLI